MISSKIAEDRWDDIYFKDYLKSTVPNDGFTKIPNDIACFGFVYDDYTVSNRWDQDKKLDIFICAHRDFKFKPTNPCYKIITSKGVNITKSRVPVLYEEGVSEVTNMQRAYGECSRIYWIRHKWNLKKYVGVCHYRRYFQFYNCMPDMDKLFSKYDCVVIQSGHRNVLKDFSMTHDPADLLEACDIVTQLYPEYTKQEIDYFLNHDMVGCCNMVIMKKNDFIKWVDWYYAVMVEFNKRHNFTTDADVFNYVNNKKDVYKGRPVENMNMLYQARLHGFILERLTTLFVRHNFKADKICKLGFVMLKNN